MAMACAADGARVTPNMLDMNLDKNNGGPSIRGIMGLDTGPATPAGSAPPAVPPPPM